MQRPFGMVSDGVCATKRSKFNMDRTGQEEQPAQVARLNEISAHAADMRHDAGCCFIWDLQTERYRTFHTFRRRLSTKQFFFGKLFIIDPNPSNFERLCWYPEHSCSKNESFDILCEILIAVVTKWLHLVCHRQLVCSRKGSLDKWCESFDRNRNQIVKSYSQIKLCEILTATATALLDLARNRNLVCSAHENRDHWLKSLNSCRIRLPTSLFGRRSVLAKSWLSYISPHRTTFPLVTSLEVFMAVFRYFCRNRPLVCGEYWRSWSPRKSQNFTLGLSPHHGRNHQLFSNEHSECLPLPPFPDRNCCLVSREYWNASP